MKRISKYYLYIALFGFTCIISAEATWMTQWQLGDIGRGWPTNGIGGGPDVDFVQEANVNSLPGDPNSPSANRMADDDYYFAGIYPDPSIGIVAQDEIAMERAFGGADNSLRVHFNLPIDPMISNDTPFRFNTEIWNLHTATSGTPRINPRYGLQVLFNGVEIFPETFMTPTEVGTVITTSTFTLGDVGALYGPNNDNILELRGTNTLNNGDGSGSNWMGMDYHALELNVIPEPSTFGLVLCGVIVALIGRRRTL